MNYKSKEELLTDIQYLKPYWKLVGDYIVATITGIEYKFVKPGEATYNPNNYWGIIEKNTPEQINHYELLHTVWDAKRISVKLIPIATFSLGLYSYIRIERHIPLKYTLGINIISTGTIKLNKQFIITNTVAIKIIEDIIVHKTAPDELFDYLKEKYSSFREACHYMDFFSTVDTLQ